MKTNIPCDLYRACQIRAGVSSGFSSKANADGFSVHLWKGRALARRLVAVVLTFFAFSIGLFKATRLPGTVSPAKPSFPRISAPGAGISDFSDFPPG
jgi:hypothetical protein